MIGALGLQGECFRRHRDRFVSLADFHRHINTGDIADVENDCVLDVLFEARSFGGEPVSAGFEKWNRIDALVIGDGGRHLVGAHVEDLDRNFRYGRAG